MHVRKLSFGVIVAFQQGNSSFQEPHVFLDRVNHCRPANSLASVPFDPTLAPAISFVPQSDIA
jgi:hypothetical protein